MTFFCVFGRFWEFFREFLKVFEYFWLFSLHAFFDGIHVFDVILKIVDCFWWFFHVFLTIFKCFERYLVHFKGFLLWLMAFDVCATGFYDFLGIFDEFSCFLYYCWRLLTNFWRSVLFFEVFCLGFNGFSQFFTYLGCFGQVFDDFLTVF